MSALRRSCFLVIQILLLQCFTTLVFAQRNSIGADGKTLEKRAQEWLNSVPSPSRSLDMDKRHAYLMSWLEKGVYNEIVSETLQDFVGNAWLDGIRAQHAYGVMIALAYGSQGNRLISSLDEEKILARYDEWILTSSTFGDLNANKQIAAMVGVYLYTSAYDRNLRFPLFGYPISLNTPIPKFYKDHWPSFDYNGNSYDFGRGPYNARQLAQDWLEWIMDGWFVRKSSPRGNREFDSIVYSRAYPAAMALLAHMASDPNIKRKAKMVTDLFHLDAVMDYSANAWGGTMGRNDYDKNARPPIYPFHHYFGMGDVLDGGDGKWSQTASYFLNYRPTDVIIDAGILDDESDNYWHLHKEYNEGLLNDAGKGKWTYVTKFYNMGSNVGQPRQGWQLSVKGSGRTNFIRLWINEQSQRPPDNQEVNYLGSKGRQFRNAMFVPLGSKPYLHEQFRKTSWEVDERDGLWRFKKLGRVMVAVGMTEVTASVEVAISGVDYGSWEDFKTAIKNKSLLTNESYTTSKGKTIDENDFCGVTSPGDVAFPFKRIETIDYLGNKIVNWNNNVMTVTRHGNTVTYNFNNWTYSEDNSNPDFTPPVPPGGVRAESD